MFAAALSVQQAMPTIGRQKVECGHSLEAHLANLSWGLKSFLSQAQTLPGHYQSISVAKARLRRILHLWINSYFLAPPDAYEKPRARLVVQEISL